VPTYPGFEIEVEALREQPEIIAEASVPATLDHLSDVVDSLDQPPIIMGHSFGGTFTQLLVNRGLGAAAVTIDSAPPEGTNSRTVHTSPVSSLAGSRWPTTRSIGRSATLERRRAEQPPTAARLNCPGDG